MVADSFALGIVQEPGHDELIFVCANGTTETWCYGYQPTTNDIAARAKKGAKGNPYTHCVQKIGNRFEVYDLKTLKRSLPYVRSEDYTIGLPVATHENIDAAIMAAILID